MSEKLLLLLQLCNSSFPLGAYSYSEGLETLIEEKRIIDNQNLNQWLINELKYGSIRIELAIVIRSYNCYLKKDLEGLLYWNDWFSASRETSELRQQSWQMGKSFLRLMLSFESENQDLFDIINSFDSHCNYAIAFGILTAHWEIKIEDLLLGYIHNWINNLINVGVKLIPLGQTEGQNLLLNIKYEILKNVDAILSLKDEELSSCSWGLSLASIKHEQLYSRLFRS
ncbi:urease accessory protein UreF [Geminocystis sp. NIES-3708]|uniref:urease accessory protein UreF n=1 Tax=Geminocystis sp. NIES-3708 TaxID=1615909 RepID=UPI0005FC58BB|nr:urease accessory protein UreF [Geminocystis sp. NIES-3708]BAQ60587.1 urease accessory protein UreF [Geminocystis sp. NIES-3708]